jgi:hypothetical protein
MKLLNILKKFYFWVLSKLTPTMRRSDVTPKLQKAIKEVFESIHAAFNDERSQNYKGLDLAGLHIPITVITENTLIYDFKFAGDTFKIEAKVYVHSYVIAFSTYFLVVDRKNVPPKDEFRLVPELYVTVKPRETDISRVDEITLLAQMHNIQNKELRGVGI